MWDERSSLTCYVVITIWPIAGRKVDFFVSFLCRVNVEGSGLFLTENHTGAQLKQPTI